MCRQGAGGQRVSLSEGSVRPGFEAQGGAGSGRRGESTFGFLKCWQINRDRECERLSVLLTQEALGAAGYYY